MYRTLINYLESVSKCTGYPVWLCVVIFLLVSIILIAVILFAIVRIFGFFSMSLSALICLFIFSSVGACTTYAYSKSIQMTPEKTQQLSTYYKGAEITYDIDKENYEKIVNNVPVSNYGTVTLTNMKKGDVVKSIELVIGPNLKDTSKDGEYKANVRYYQLRDNLTEKQKKAFNSPSEVYVLENIS